MTSKGLKIENLSVHGKGETILKGINLQVSPGKILGVIGPAGSGKTTLLRAINRLIDLDEGMSVSGQVYIDGNPVYGDKVDAVGVRRKAGLVFSVPVPLPFSIRENLVFGPALNGIRDAKIIKKRLESALKAAYLWEEVKDRMMEPAANLSGGQQQRLCLARTLALRPDVLLLDEPCSSLDPISTAKIEEALTELKKEIAVVLVTNNVKQASRISDQAAFLLMGELVEDASTQELFTNPQDRRTEEYITGRFG